VRQQDYADIAVSLRTSDDLETVLVPLGASTLPELF
jgi:hypothetical protein